MLFPIHTTAQNATNDSLARFHYKELRVWYQKDLDSAAMHAQKAYDNYRVIGDTAKQSRCLNALTSIHYSQGEIIDAIRFSKMSYHLILDFSKRSDRKLLTCANNVAVMNQENGNSPGAIRIMLEALGQVDQNKIPKNSLGIVHQNIGNNYSILGDYANARFHLTKSLELVDSTVAKDILIALCANAIRDGKFEKGNHHLSQIDTSGLKSFSLIIYRRLYGILLMEGGQLDKASIILEDLDKEIPEENPVVHVLTLLNLGEVESRRGNFLKSISWLEKANQILVKKLNSEQIVYRIEILKELAINYSLIDEFDKADRYWNQAFNANSIKVGNTREVIRDDLQWGILYAKAKAQSSKLSFEKEKQLYVEAIEHLIKSRKNLVTYKSRLDHSTRSIEMFDDFMKLLVREYKNGNGGLLDEIQNVIVLGNQLTLQESRGANKNVSQSTNQDLKEEYIRTSAGITRLLRIHPELISDNESEKLRPETIDSMMSLLDRKRELEDLLLSKEESYQMIQANKTRDIPSLLIYETDSLYYLIHDYCYQGIHEVSNSEVNDLLIGLETNWNAGGSVDEKLSMLYSLSKMLFPNGEIFTMDRMSIIAAGKLRQWPFEIFPKNNPSDNSIREIQFLGENVALDYILTIEEHEQSNSSRKLLSVAPLFRSENSTLCGKEILSPLKCNLKEAEFGQEEFTGHLISGKDIHTIDVIDEIAKYDIIHFSTHVCLDTTQMYNHKIHLGDQALHSSDLFQIDWTGKSVILSACASGSGELLKSEGSMSLARWLLELGSKEVLVTYWPIDDCRTAEFMKWVFQSWKKNENLAEAVKLARRQYFETSDDYLLSPEDWGAFVVVREKPYFESATFFNLKFLMWLVALVLVGYFFIQQVINRRKKLS